MWSVRERYDCEPSNGRSHATRRRSTSACSALRQPEVAKVSTRAATTRKAVPRCRARGAKLPVRRTRLVRGWPRGEVPACPRRISRTSCRRCTVTSGRARRSTTCGSCGSGWPSLMRSTFRAQPAVNVRCQECGTTFELSPGHARQHVRRDLATRCRFCRRPGARPTAEEIARAKRWWLKHYSVDELQSWPPIW